MRPTPNKPPLRLVADPPASSGSADRVRAAFLEYGRYVATIAYRILGTDDDLEDLVQEVFLQAHREVHRLRDPGALRSWLATVTVRAARRALRARRIRAFLFAPFSHEDDAPDPGGSGEQHALVARVYRELDRLPTDDRIAWTLRVIEGESLEDVAALCHCSLSTAKRRISRAQAVMSRFGAADLHLVEDHQPQEPSHDPRA